MLWTTAFWRGAGERALKTWFQTLVAVLVAGVGADAVGLTAGLLDVGWLDAASVATLAAILSVATSIGNADFTAGPTSDARCGGADFDGAGADFDGGGTA